MAHAERGHSTRDTTRKGHTRCQTQKEPPTRDTRIKGRTAQKEPHQGTHAQGGTAQCGRGPARVKRSKGWNVPIKALHIAAVSYSDVDWTAGVRRVLVHWMCPLVRMNVPAHHLDPPTVCLFQLHAYTHTHGHTPGHPKQRATTGWKGHAPPGILFAPPHNISHLASLPSVASSTTVVA